MKTFVELKEIKKTFRSQKTLLGDYQRVVCAVDNVSLDIEEGQNVGLVGESGCGKTTFARILLKLVPADSGSIHLRGEEVGSLTPREFRPYRKHIQMVFQDPYSSLDPRFTIRNIILEAMSLDNGAQLTFAEKEKQIKGVLASVHLSDQILDRYPHEFSGGERQRIAIARALVMNPQLLVLDEALSSLDVIIQSDLLDLLAEIQKKYALTYLFISHNLKVVKKICHKIAVMYQGRIVELAPRAELFGNPLHPYTKELLSAAMEYKPLQNKDFSFSFGEGRLVEKEKGHFVLM